MTAFVAAHFVALTALLSWVMAYIDHRNKLAWDFYGYVLAAAANMVVAVADAVDGNQAMAAVRAALAGVIAWIAWRKRPPRRRRPSKVAAKVRDLGHRLVVVPAGGVQ